MKNFSYQKMFELYVVSGLTITAVSSILNSNTITIKKYLKKYDIPIDSNRRSSNDKFFLSKKDVEIINGALLGDGHLSSTSTNAQFCYISSISAHTNYIYTLLRNYAEPAFLNGPIKREIYDNRTQKTYINYTFRTKLNQSFTKIRNYWYVYKKKFIPKNINLTPLTCLIWYLGDGSLVNNYKKKETGLLKLSTNCFDKNDLEKIIIPQLLGFEAYIGKSDSGPVILIPRRKIESFLKYIGPCPFEEYDYKWKVFPYKNKNIEKNGVTSHFKKVPKIIKLYKEGIPAHEVGKKLNIGINVVKYHLRKNNIFDSAKNHKIVNWILISPSGATFDTTSLVKFASEHNLNHLSLRRVAKNEQEMHKGWKCYYKNKV